MDNELTEGWGIEETEISAMTMEQINQLAETYKKFDEVCENLENQAKEVAEKRDRIGHKILEYMQTYCQPQKGKKTMEFQTVAGTFKALEVKEVKMSDKESLFAYLKEKNLFEAMASINARTLSGWAKKEADATGSLPPGTEFNTPYYRVKLSPMAGDGNV